MRLSPRPRPSTQSQRASLSDRSFRAAFVAVSTLALGAPAARADTADGVWRSPVKHSDIELFNCGTELCGRAVDSDDLRANPDLRDFHNRDPALRDRRVKGLVFLSGFKGGPTEWTGGHIYDPQTGNTYEASISVKGPDKVVLTGCIIKPFCLAQTWKRVR